ncbi:MAG: TrmH family RNA methyltransferase [Lachnospiraceae bacterium]
MMDKITTSNHSKVRYVMQLQKKSKTRREESMFIVEGPKMFQELPKERMVMCFVSESFAKKQENLSLLKDISYEVVKDSVFEDMSDTKTPQGILAVAKQFSYTLDSMLQRKDAHLLILETIQDPGNLGTMIRAGEAAGITGVIMNRETVDIYNPKTIRSTMGSLYRVPFYCTDSLEETIQAVKAAGISTYAAHLSAAQSYDGMDYRKPTAFLIGNEANGLSDSIAQLASAYIKIPMKGHSESLNAAIAASVLMFEAARQRRMFGDV